MIFNIVMQDFICCFDIIKYAVYHTERKVVNYEAFNRVNKQSLFDTL